MSGAPTGQAARHVLKAPLFRQQGKSIRFSDAPPPAAPKREPVRRPAKVARMLALAHHLQRAIDQGLVADRAEVARKLGLTRARVTQLLDLLLLAPDVQAEVLALEAVDAVEPLPEGDLRRMSAVRSWPSQRRAWNDAKPPNGAFPCPL